MTWRAPEADPKAWDSIPLVDVKKRVVTLPPSPNMGTARCSMPSEIKIDTKSAAGKNGSTQTRQGVRDGAITIDIEVASWAWPQLEVALDAIDPRGPSVGGPFLLVAPNLPKGYGGIQITKITRGTAVNSDGRIKIQITGKECAFPKAGGTGGKGGTKKLSDAERIAAQLALNLLEQRIRTDTLLLDSAERADKVRELVNSIDSLRKQAEALKKQLAANPQPTSATSTPTGPGQAYGGAKGGNQSNAPDPKSYDPAKNPEAPTGAP